MNKIKKEKIVRPFQSEVLANQERNLKSLLQREREESEKRDDDGDTREHCRFHRPPYVAIDSSSHLARL